MLAEVSFEPYRKPLFINTIYIFTNPNNTKVVLKLLLGTKSLYNNIEYYYRVYKTTGCWNTCFHDAGRPTY